MIFPIEHRIIRLILLQQRKGQTVITGGKGGTGLIDNRMIGRVGGVFVQKLTDGLSQLLCQIGQSFHGRMGGAVFDLREHIPGDLIAAKLSLG
jgi:hypothetical protein